MHASHSWSHLYEQTRLHVLLVNRAPDDDLPLVIVAISGPLGVGKTTLLKSVMQNMKQKDQSQFTFVRCNNDRNCMVEMGNIADLLLLMVDGSFGLEMVCIIHVL